MPKTADRLTFFTESVIREMTRVSNQYGAINLSHGFPTLFIVVHILEHRPVCHGSKTPHQIHPDEWPLQRRKVKAGAFDPRILQIVNGIHR